MRVKNTAIWPIMLQEKNLKTSQRHSVTYYCETYIGSNVTNCIIRKKPQDSNSMRTTEMLFKSTESSILEVLLVWLRGGIYSKRRENCLFKSVENTARDSETLLGL